MHNHDGPFPGSPMSSILGTRRKLKLSRESSLSSSLSNMTVIFFNYFVQKRAVNYDITVYEVCIITTVSRKKNKTREYSLRTMSRSTPLLVVCRHASDGGRGSLLDSTHPPG